MTTQFQTMPFPEETFQLDPFDQERYELLGELPDLPLLAPCKVHTIETTDENRLDKSYRAYALKNRMNHYIRALEIYAKIDGGFHGKYTTRLKTCRKYAFFFRNNETGHLRIQSSRCKLRWCPICRDVSRQIVTTAVDGWLCRQKYPKMLTFTLKHSDDELFMQVQHLYDCFRKIRQRAYFKQNINGGVWFFQLKLNLQTNQWHPHIHCLVNGNFLKHSRLSELWHKITGDSFVIDVRPVRDLENASTEVARYATSPADITRMTLQQAIDVYDATQGRRICGTWGDAKGMILKPTPQEDTEEWSKVAEFTFINIRRDYDRAVQTFWDCYVNNKPYDGPQLQPETEVYAEELDLLLEPEELEEKFREFHRKRWRVNTIKTNFIMQTKTSNGADNGYSNSAK
jgi:hypothetical protein